MNRRQFHEDWERKKEYLVQPLFAEPPVLSPIPEHSELSSFVDQPLHRSDSPLPELIIEKEKRRRHDRSNKFYNKLEIKMKKFYRKLFFGEDVDMHESISENYSSESITKDSGSSTEENKSKGGTNTMDDEITILDELSPIKNAEQLLDAEPDTPLVKSDENNDTEFHGVISQNNASTDEVQELLSQKFTEQLEENNICEDDLETTSSNESTASENSNNSNEKNYVLAEKAIIHATEDKYQEDPEIMRKQRSSSLGELLNYDGDNTPKHLRLDLNEAYLTMEQISDSTSSINPPTSMAHSIIQATPPVILDSPILGPKRPSSEPYHKSSKKRKVTDEINSISDKNDTIYQNVFIEQNTSRINVPCLFDRDVQVHHDINHTEIQTESVNHREVGVQTDENEEYVTCRNAAQNATATQTEQTERRDQSTQTDGQFFEYFRIYIIRNHYY